MMRLNYIAPGKWSAINFNRLKHGVSEEPGSTFPLRFC
jgi:hypothetical protein